MVEMLQGLKIATSCHLYLIMVVFNKSHPDLTGIFSDLHLPRRSQTSQQKGFTEGKNNALPNFFRWFYSWFPTHRGLCITQPKPSCTIFARQNSLKMTFATFASSLITPKNGWHLMTRNNPTPQFLQLQKSHRSFHQNLHPTCFDSSFRQICLPRCHWLAALIKG